MTYKWFTSWFNKKRQLNNNAIDFGNREPLDHPELVRMTPAELADLPMPAYVKENCNVQII